MTFVDRRTAGSAETRAERPDAGPRIYNLFPLLVGPVPAWTAELPRIAAMNFDWVYLNPFHETGGSGSLYAVRDPFRLDPRFRSGDEDDEAQLRRFIEAAAALGLKVMTDLVVNHTARDAPLAEERPHLFRRDEFGALLSPFAIDPVDPSIRTVWGDLAELDYGQEGTRGELSSYFDGYIAGLQRIGVKGFRCDAAYKVPAETWRDLIGGARSRDARVVFAAETLGCTPDETKATARAGFDYLFNSFAWWDLRASWALDQYEDLRTVAPSIAFPENHDMARLAADLGEDRERIASALRARYALAAFFSTGVLMPIGYEWGYRRPLHVVETTPQHREMTGIDISAFVADVNRLRAELPTPNVEGAQSSIAGPDSPIVALLRIDAGHPVAASHATLVLFNPGEAPREIAIAPLFSRMGGLFGPLRDVSPGSGPATIEPEATLTLAPLAVRILSAARAAVPKLRRSDKPPSGENRVVIEKVTPQIDEGRSAIKRIVGDVVAVEADIFTDGHDKIAAAVAYRPAGETEWRHSPMAFVDNDRWAGTFPLDRNARFQYAVVAWRDPVESWRAEAEAKRAAGQNLRLEAQEGLSLAREAAGHAEGAASTRLAEIVAAAEAEPDWERQLDILLAAANIALIRRHGERENLSRSAVLEVVADRLAARFSAWYELFPRSQSRDANRHGTFDDVIARLPYVKDLGFDVLYFPPIHPIGVHEPQGTQQRAQSRARRSGQRLCDRLRGRRPYGDPSGPRHARRFPPPRRRGARARPRDRPRLRDPVLAGPPLDRRASGMVRLAAGRDPQVRREPAEEIRGHRQRPFLRRFAALAVARAQGRGDVLGRGGRAHLPRRQPAHEADPVLGMAHRGRERAPSRCHLPRRGVHAAEDDAQARESRLPAILHLLHLAQHEAGTRLLHDRARPFRNGRVLPAELFREHAGHQPDPAPDERPRRLHRPRHPRGDALEFLRHLQRLRALRGDADPRPGGIPQLRKIRDQGL